MVMKSAPYPGGLGSRLRTTCGGQTGMSDAKYSSQVDRLRESKGSAEPVPWRAEDQHVGAELGCPSSAHAVSL